MTIVPLVLPASRLVGRDQQLGELQRIFDEVRAGRPATAVVAGEAGIGKSRLIAEFADRARIDGARVVVGHAVPIDGGGPAFTPVVGVLRALVDDLGPDVLLDLAGPGGSVLGTLVPALGGADGIPSGHSGDRGPLYEVITSLLERVAADAPLIVAIEDIHWSDAASRDLLRFVVRGLFHAPVLTLLSYRSDELHRGHPVRPWLAELERVPAVHRIDVPRLDRESVTAQLADLLGRQPSASEVGSVFRRSEGVPFFVEELASASSHAGVPSTVSDILLTRLERLRPEAQRVLRVLSASGSGVRHDLVDAVIADMGTEALDDALREAVSVGVLTVRDDRYVFRHALLREAVHDDMLPGERARIHAAYAEALEARRDLAQQDRCASEVAYHWTQARNDERAFRWSLDAIGELAEVYAFGAALEAAERALELWDRVADPHGVSGGDQIELLSRAARLATEAGELGRGLSLTKAALAGLAPDDVERLGTLTATRGELEIKLGMTGSIDTLKRAWELTVPVGTRARVADGMAMMLMLSGRFEDSMTWADQALVLAEKDGNEPLMSSAHNTRGTCQFHLRDNEAAVTEFDLARRLCGDHPRSLLRYHINYSDTLMLMRRYDDAVDLAMAGKVRARELGRKRSLGSMLAGNAAEPLMALGEWDRALALVERALELDPPGVHVYHLRLLQTTLTLWRGDVARAAEALEFIDAGTIALTVPQNTRPLAKVRADLAMALDDPDTAWAAVREELPTDPHDLIAAYDFSLVAVGARVLAARARTGAVVTAEAADLADAAAAMDQTMPGSPWPLLIAAELTPPTAVGAVTAWKAAVARLDAADSEALLRPYSQLRLARAQLESGDRVGAATTLGAAATGAEDLGAGLLRTWVDDLARRGRLAIPGSTSPADNTAGLTARELEVLGLVAEGHSNRDIGAQLYISTKTASVHVSNILAKLGVSSRGEAAAVARRRGILDRYAS